jgi:hypothetical protein
MTIIWGPRVYAAGALSREAKFPYKLFLAAGERKRKSIVSRLIKFCAGSFPEIRWRRRAAAAITLECKTAPK